MNILFISPNSPRESIGGIERYITNLIDYYQKHKEHQIVLLMPTKGENHIEINDNITTYYDNSLMIPRKIVSAQKEISKKARVFSELVDEIIKKHNLDIICAENFMFGPPAIYSLLLNMITSTAKIPLILRLHMFPSTPLQMELVNQLMWRKISCVSKSVTGDCFQKGSDINLLSTDYLGVNTALFNTKLDTSFNLKNHLGLPKESKIILTAARIIRGNTNILKEKGLINLIQAFSKLAPLYPELRLVFAIGQASEILKPDFDHAYDMLLGYIKLHNIEEQTVVKIFKLEEMPNVYKGADLFVLPAENETFGQVFIEAMSCGIPVIGTKSGGIPEIITDSTDGFLVPPDDSSILSQRIEVLLNDEEKRTSFIFEGIKTVRDKFTLEKQFTHFTQMLEETATSYQTPE